MTDRISLYDYLSIKEGENGKIIIKTKKIENIRDQFALMTDNEPNDLLLKELSKKLNIKDDDENLELLRICITQATINDVKTEICQIYSNKLEMNLNEDTQITDNENIIFKKEILIQPINNIPIEEIIEINCIIQIKVNHPEIQLVFKDFLLRSLDQQISSNSTISLEKNVIYPLIKRSILDLFIRQQLHQRGVIDFGRERSRFRLIESISLNDEFDTWHFDHFHSLFEFFLNLPNEKLFPIRWKFSDQSIITYQIIYIYETQLNNDEQKQIQRPSTKSLEKFIEDICHIEDNGMASIWIKLLRQEDITTYAHLTNLNQKEWESIRKLTMNALKTIKTYVDREKQTAEQKTSSTKKKSKKTKGESECELLAKIHMIKLYFNYALKDEEGIIPLPKLDSRCVKKSFEEMSEDYEDDGLFDEMMQFFLPLTVNDNELELDENEINYYTLKKRLSQNQNEEDILNLTKKNDILIKNIEERKGYIQQIQLQRQRIYDELQKKIEEIKKEKVPGYLGIKSDLEKEWSDKDTLLSDQKKMFEKEIDQYETKLKANEALIQEKNNLLKTILDDIQNQQTHIDQKLVKPHRGFIMYGPPGTGKSHIMSQIAKKIGIAMLGPPLAAGELERPLVGQSEAVILDLCSRGHRLPYLMCCVSIDEIDSLAPRRDEDSSEGKVAKISVLLSVIEGIKDVPNLMFFSATNRLHMMDEAFLRRMSGKFFVGRPSSQARKRILNAIPRNMLDPQIRQKLTTATTNFSGAALSALNRSIAVHFIAQRRDNKNYKISYNEALLQADLTARQYQIYLGLDTLPRLLKRNIDNTNRSMNNENSNDVFHLKNERNYTGKIIISLSDRSVRIEYFDRIQNCKKVNEDKLNDNEENIQQLLERITNYGNDRNVQLLQLIDLNLLSSKGAYDEKKIFETLKERYDECMEYKRSMIIYDLDSLIGVNQSESQSSMGTSTSSSVVHQALYIYVMSRFREAVIETNNKLNVEKWSIAVIRDSFLFKKFSQDVDFPRTDKEEQQFKEDQRKEKELIKCVKCRDYFIENDNKMGNCNYHDGFVYDNSSIELTKYTSTQVSNILNNDEFHLFNNPDKKDDIERKKGRFKFICCDTIVQTGQGSTNGGCKKGKHGYGKISKRNKILTKEQIHQWEQFCSDNDEYNQRWIELINNRSNHFI